ncbi:hypothetical protein K474DRAFT_1603825, partial [Panus rudis PR-1116 ss-1]
MTTTTTRTTTRTMPPELADYTLDFLHDDAATLGSCALTCKAWLPTSRFHLFHTLKLGH